MRRSLASFFVSLSRPTEKAKEGVLLRHSSSLHPREQFSGSGVITKRKQFFENVPDLQHFLKLSDKRIDCSSNSANGEAQKDSPSFKQKTVHIESYGCQMNMTDTEVVLSILYEAGYSKVAQPTAADVVLLNTCAIRENAEAKVGMCL